MNDIPYRQSESPPYPALRVEFSCGSRTHVCEGKLDTGASCTCVPEEILNALCAPPGDRTSLCGYDGGRTPTWTYYVSIEVTEPNWPRDAPARFDEVQVCAIPVGSHAEPGQVLIGRDLLRNWFLLLEGPHDTLQVQPSRG